MRVNRLTSAHAAHGHPCGGRQVSPDDGPAPPGDDRSADAIDITWRVGGRTQTLRGVDGDGTS